MKNIMNRTTKFKLIISILVLFLNIGIVSNVFATQTRSPKMLGTATYNGQELSGSNDTMTYEQTETAKALIINAQFSSASVPKKIEVDIVPGFEYKTIPGMVKTGETWTFDASKLLTQEAMIISKVEFVPGTPFYNNIPRHGKVIITLKNDATSANIELGINRDNQYYYGTSNITDTYTDAISAKVFENNIQKDYEKLETLNITRAVSSFSIFALLNSNLLSTGDSYTTNYSFGSTVNNNGFPVTNVKKIDAVMKVNKNFGVNNIAITGSSNLTYTKVTGSDSNFDYFNIIIDNFNPSSRINFSGEIGAGATPGNYAFMTADSFKSYDVNDRLLADRSVQVYQSSTIFAIAKESDNKLEYRNYGMPSNNSNRIAEEEIDIYNDLNKSMYLGAFEMSNSSKVDIVDQKMEISFNDPSYQIKAVKLLNVDSVDVSKNIVVKTNKTSYTIPSLVGVYANANISLAKLGSTDSSEYIEKVTYEFGKVKSGFESRAGDYYIGSAAHKVVEYYGNIVNKPADNKLKVSVISVDKSLDFSDNSASTFTSITDIVPLSKASITVDSNLTGTYLSNSTVTSTHTFLTQNYMPSSPRSQMIKGYNIYLSDKSGELEALKNTIKLTEQDGTVYSVADGSLVPIEMVDNLGNKVIKISMPNNYVGRIYDESTGYSLFGLKSVTVDYKVPAIAKTQTIKTESNISIVPSNPATAARVFADTATINYVKKDTTNLTGNTNQLLETVSPFKTYTIKADKAFVVGSSANLNNGPWTSYDYDTNATILNLNPVGQAKYRLNISNNSGSTIEGYTALIPIPKYGEKTARTPITPDLFDKREHLQKEAFGWTIAVNNPIVVPNSTVLYADTYELDKDSTNFKPWSSFANKDEIRMVKVTNNTSMPNEYSEEFNFPLDLSDPAADAHAGNSNTYSSLIHRDIDGNAGYSPSEPVSIRLKTGILNGKIMLDKDASNTNNTGDTPLVGVSVIARNKVTQAIEDTTVTNSDGEYTFLGLEKTQKIDVEIVNPSVDQYKFNSKVAGGSDAEALADQTKASIKDLTPSTDINKLVLLVQPVTVTYDSQGGVASKSSEKAFPTYQLTMPTVDERTGYTLNGWYTAANGGTKVTGTYTTPATNVTLYAQWTVNTYNLKYNNQGNETNHSVVYNTDLPAAPNATKAGYTFNGWYTAASGGTSVDTTTAKMPANDWTIYAQFIADNQTITFDTKGGSTAPSNIVQATDSTVNLSTISEPTKAGYSFDGWYVGDTKYSGTFNMPVGGLNLTAEWIAVDQTITFDAKGGTPTPANIVQPTDSSVDFDAVEKPVRDGYTFKGWFLNNTEYTGVITMPVGGLNLVAHYETEKFTGNQLTSPIKDLSKINDSYLISKVDPKAWLEDGEGVKIKDCIISSVDFSALKDKVGSYPIIFTTDSGETHTIYYSVGKTKSPVTNETHALDASDFTMELDEFKDAVKAGTIKEKVINASSAKAWEIKTNKEVKGLEYKLTSTKDITKVGQYGISFTTADLETQSNTVDKKATVLSNNVTLTIVENVTPIEPILPETGLDYVMYSLIAGIIGITAYGFKAINRRKG